MIRQDKVDPHTQKLATPRSDIRDKGGVMSIQADGLGFGLTEGHIVDKNKDVPAVCWRPWGGIQRSDLFKELLQIIFAVAGKFPVCIKLRREAPDTWIAVEDLTCLEVVE